MFDFIFEKLRDISLVIEKLPRSLLITFGYFFTIALEIINYFTGHEVRLIVFYFLPLFLLTWFVSEKSAILLAAFSSILWYQVGVDFLALSDLTHVWNALTRFAISLGFIYVVRAYKKERTFARQDYLTKIANKQQFTEMAMMEIERCRRYGRPFSAVYMDVDDFKKINDTLGHRAGDELLFQVAQTLRNNIRSADTVARLGGDEFAILLPETNFEPGCKLINNIQRLLLEKMQEGGWQCTFSFGLVTFPMPPANVDELIHCADTLMYKAKETGKNKIICTQYGLQDNREKTQ